MKLFLTITNFIENYFSKIVNFLKKFLAHFALIALILEQFIFVASASAQALPIIPDGSTATQITQTASGIDQINIAPPSANGVSHNKFEDYNVNVAGQVINNFSGKNPAEIVVGAGATALTQTQIAGLVVANPNLNSTGSAKIILNEVSSGNVSQLLGYTEIAGTNADLILANPNGFTCRGCGFVNTARLLMIAGKSDFDKNGNLGFNLKEQIDPNLYVPLITIDGLGLDATRVAGTEIVASSVKLLASIYGGEKNSLTIKTGEGKYDYNTKNIDATNVNPNSPSSAPVFAIDASALAKIQAGQIYLIATKNGVGVKMEGEILASQTLNLDANGDIYYNKISAGDNANLKASGTIKNLDSEASIISPNIDIQAKNFDNSALISAYNINIKNGENFNNSGNLEALNLNFSNINNIVNSGRIFGKNYLNIAGKNLTNNSAGSIYSPQDYSIILTGFLNNSGLISSKNNLKIAGNSAIINNNKILSNGALSISASSLNNNSFSNIASLFDEVNLTIGDDFTNNGQVFSAKNLSIFANNFINSGDVLADSKLITTIANQITNFGNFQSLLESKITASTIDNSGLIKSFDASTILANKITNKNNATIYSRLDNAISASSLTNDGSILSDANLTINSGLTSNIGEIFANKDLLLNLTNSFTNQGSLGAVDNLTINSDDAIINDNKILSNGNLKIVATSLNNSSAIQSNGNIAIILNNLSNSKNISANKDLNIVADASVSNSGTMQSVESFNIETNNFSNLSKSLILAGGNLKIRASAINNQNTKSVDSYITSGIVSANGAVNIFTDNLNNNAGIIAGKSTSLSALNNASVNLENNLGSFISTAEIILNLGNLDYTITGTITASNIDITANNIANQGNVTASDFINLNATGISGVAGSGNIINGFTNGDNSNVSLASGTYINLIARNNIENYGAIIGNTDITLTATDGNINNYGTGKITAGSGMAIANAISGAFNNNAQTSLFTADNNAIFNVKNLNNFGEISVANDLITNITNNLINNPTALIWSGRDATFNVANTFLNNQADIYADRNLTIQKNNSLDSTQNKTNLVQNISGNIETYGGDINIKAVALENKRSSMKTQGADFVYGQAYVTGGDCHRNRLGRKKCNPVIYRDLHARNIYGIAGLEASVLSGGGINITSNSLLNDASSIISSANFGINTSIFNNNSYSFVQYDDTSTRYEYYTAFIKSGGALIITQNGASNPSLINGGNVSQYVSAGRNSKQSQNTSINKIDIYKLAQTGVLEVDLSAIINALNSKNISDLNVIDAQTDSAKQATSDISISGISEASDPNANFIFSGNFKINLDPSATTPIFEKRGQFTDVSKFFGSKYYFDQLGLNGSAVLADIDHQIRSDKIRMLGDSFVESKLIIDQLKKLTKDSLFLSKTTTDPNQQIKELLDNSVNQFATLGLNAKDVAMKGLTAQQANSLSKDIVTFELANVNGVQVLAPKIYLSQDTRNRLFNPDSVIASPALANSSTIFAKENLTIDSPNASLVNNGSIASGGDLNMNIASLTNKTNSMAQAQIIANNNLSITAQEGDIKNIGAKIEASGSLSLEALKGDILNSAIVQTNDKNLLNQNADSYQLAIDDTAKSSGNIASTLLQNASFKGGSIAINAGNDFTNLGAEISATKNILNDGSVASGNLSITASDDITIGTLELRNREEKSWGNRKKGGSLVVDETKNIGSDIESAGALSLRTTGLGVDSENSGNPQNSNPQGSNIEITGSNLKSSENINIASKDDITIQASQDVSYQQSQSWKKGLTVAKSSTTGSESITNNLSTLTSSGNIILASSSDINLIGTKLNAENVAISSGEEVNIYSVSDYDKSWSSSTKSRNYSSLTGGLVGASAPLIYSDPMTVVAMTAIHLGLDTNNSFKSSSNSTEKTSNIASIIEAKNDIAINSNQNLTISGSDVSGKTGSITSNQGNVDILSAQEIEKNISSNKLVERATNAPGLKGSKNNSSETDEVVKNIASNLTFTDSLAIQTNGNSTDPNQSADVNIEGSNLTVNNGDLNIASKGNVIIENAIDSNFKESSSKKINETTKNIAKAIDYVETASSSNLNANNINISSLGDTVIQGSNIKTQENLLIGSFAIEKNPDGSYQKDANGNYITTTGSAVDNLVIKDAELQEYHYAQKAKGYTGAVGLGVRALPYALAPIEIAIDSTKEVLGTFLPQNYEDLILDDLKIGEVFNANDKVKDEIDNIKISQTSQTHIDKTNSIASNLDINGSMMINAVNDVLIKGSNLDISGDLLANSLGSFEVVASKNTQSITAQESFETAGKFNSDYKPSKANYRAGVIKDFVEEGSNSSISSVASSNINIDGSALINSSDQFALIASNLISNDSVEIIAKNNLNISDAKNTQSTSSYQEKITLDTGIKVGNAYVDAGNAVIDALKATKEIKDSYDKLEKIKDLKDQGMASSKAVERAEYQVVLALLNAGLSSANAMQAVANAGVAYSTSLGTGLYGSIYADITKLKSTSTTESSQSIASNLIANNSINLASGNGDINITGSNVSSINGDLNLNSMLGNINIKAGESTLSQSSKSNSKNLGGSIGTNGVSANIGFSEAQSSIDQTTFSNSQISAINGSLNINSAKDTKIIGANLLASNVNMNIGNNLLLKSTQNLLESDSYNIGMSIGISGDSSGVNGGSLGLNLGNGYSNRAFVDQVSSIIATNLVNINVANDTNIAGALIANQNKEGIDLGNLNLKTKSLTYSDLNNFSVSESNQLGLNLQAGYNPNNPTQNGNLAINLNMQGRESSSTTKATIGKGNISIDEILNDETKIANLNRDINNIEQNKRDVITSDFDAELKIDLRLIASVGNLAVGNSGKATANWDSYANQTKKGANITYDALAIPLNSLSEAISGDINVSDALLATGKNYQNLYQLAYNQNIVLTDLAGEGNLITYNGNQLDSNAQSRYANGFYDRNSDTLAINADSNRSDAQLAKTSAHEGAHRMFNNNAQSYTLSEENASHMIGDFTESRWDTYQSDNTSLRDSLPTPTLNFSNNFYANNVEFGDKINPLVIDNLANVIKPGLGDSINNDIKNFKENSLNNIADQYVSSNNSMQKVGLAVMLGMGYISLPESVTDIELSAIIGGVSKAYAPEIATGLNKVDDVANGFWSKLFGGSNKSNTSLSNSLPVYRQGTFADEAVGWEGNYIKGQQWAAENPLTTPNYVQKYGLPAENSAVPDWIVGGKVDGPYTTRPAPASHNSLLNTGGGNEILPQNPDNVKLDWFHMPDK